MEARYVTGETVIRTSVGATVRSRRGRHDWKLRRLLAIGDAAAIELALVLAFALGGRPGAGSRLLWGLAVIPLMSLLFKLYGLYDRDVKRISHLTIDDLPWLFHASLVGSLVVWFYSWLSPMRQLDVTEGVLFAAGTFVIATVTRFAMRRTAGRMFVPERAILIGGGEIAGTLAGKLEAHPEYRLEVVGRLEGSRPTSDVAGVSLLGELDQLDQVVASMGLERVLISPGGVGEDELAALLRRCRSLNLKVSILPQLSDALGPAVEVDDVEGVAVLGLNPPWLPRSSRALKRAMDLAVAAPLIVILAPVMAMIALAIKLGSRGPAFFGQDRVGRDGQRFRLYKFRTMSTDAEQRRDELAGQSSDPHWLKLDHDPRITPFGRRLRRYSLDELPQLWNVLRGEMSLVGPRPLIESEDRLVEGWARDRLDLTPGVTGYWQVLGRTRIPFEEMVKLDYLYVMNWSVWGDLRLIMRTLPAVLSGRGAN